VPGSSGGKAERHELRACQRPIQAWVAASQPAPACHREPARGRYFALQAHPGPFLHTLLQEMHESPHAQPFVQTLQQVVATGFEPSGLRRAAAEAPIARACNAIKTRTASLRLTKA
jgi:hypothetical protein